MNAYSLCIRNYLIRFFLHLYDILSVNNLIYFLYLKEPK